MYSYKIVPGKVSEVPTMTCSIYKSICLIGAISKIVSFSISDTTSWYWYFNTYSNDSDYFDCTNTF